MFSFWWNGKNSLDTFGLWIQKLPARTRPQERYKTVEIPGKSGSLILLEGDDVYSAYNDEIVVVCKNNIPIDPVIKWLRGSGKLVLSNDSDKARQARIANEVVFERDGNCLLVGTIPFLFQPFRMSRYESSDRITITGSSASITNPGDIASRPKVSITGSGNNTITIGGTQMSFTGISDTIVVDCETEMITKGGALWTGSGTGSTGDFWKIPVGASTVTQTGSMTIAIDPGWRWF